MRRDSVVRELSTFALPVSGPLCFLVCSFAPATTPLFAQDVVVTGAVRGQVTDQSGATVPGASNTAHHVQTGMDQSANTNRSGIYQFPVLSPGSYQ